MLILSLLGWPFVSPLDFLVSFLARGWYSFPRPGVCRVVVLWMRCLHEGKKAVAHPGSQTGLLLGGKWEVTWGSRAEVNSSDCEGKREERSYWWRVPASETGFLADLRAWLGRKRGRRRRLAEAERIMKQASCTRPGGDALERDGDLSVDWDLSMISGVHFYMDLDIAIRAQPLHRKYISCPHLYSVWIPELGCCGRCWL